MHMPKELSSLGWKRRDQNRVDNRINNRYFSFEEICPQWTLALRLGYTINLDLDIQDAKKCIVGEAHGFRNRCLLCSKCWEYSQSFTFCLYGNKLHRYIITDLQKFEDLKSNFVDHFNQRHLSKLSYQQKIIDPLFRGIFRFYHKLRMVWISLFLSEMIPKGRCMLLTSASK